MEELEQLRQENENLRKQIEFIKILYKEEREYGILSFNYSIHKGLVLQDKYGEFANLTSEQRIEEYIRLRGKEATEWKKICSYFRKKVVELKKANPHLSFSYESALRD